jgi:hypothetical protein
LWSNDVFYLTHFIYREEKTKENEGNEEKEKEK